MAIPSRPCGYVALTGVTTSGSAAAIPNGSAAPYIPPTVARVYVSAKSYVCLGDDNSPDAASSATCVIQQATTERDYLISDIANDLQDYVWVYSLTSTVDVDVSFLG